MSEEDFSQSDKDDDDVKGDDAADFDLSDRSVSVTIS